MSRRTLLILLSLAVLLRIGILVLSGRFVNTPWSGGGDMQAYVLMARNLAAGDGYSYAHIPSALRPPGYAGLLAAMMLLFGEHFLIAARCVQFAAGLAASWFALRAARIWFGKASGRMAMFASLLFPTLVYFSGEILSEAMSAFFVAAFVWALAEDSAQPRWATAVWMGLPVGAGAMFRPNVALLGVVAVAEAWIVRRGSGKRPDAVTADRRLDARHPLAQVAAVALCAAIVVGPWVLRNFLVFGKVLFSTEGGSAALFAAVNPEARDTPGSEEKMRAALGFLVPNDLEVNDASRLRLGDEVTLNQRCWELTREIWSQMGWRAVPWTLGKWATFWLSTDQLLRPGRISMKNRIAHSVGVFLYWGLLALALAGWWRLKGERPEIAMVLLGYGLLATLAHTPFVMNSRIRAPLLDPLLAVLAGGGLAASARSRRARASAIPLLAGF